MRHTKVLFLFVLVWVVWKVRIADGVDVSCQVKNSTNLRQHGISNNKSDGDTILCDTEILGKSNNNKKS